MVCTYLICNKQTKKKRLIQNNTMNRHYTGVDLISILMKAVKRYKLMTKFWIRIEGGF